MIAVACDFAGFPLKKILVEYLEELNIPYRDFGAYDTTLCDYPPFALKAANAVASGECELGLLVCGSGVGISIAANKVKGIRCVCCSEPYSALMARQHNDANMVAMGARVVGSEVAKMILDNFLKGEFLGMHHQKRLDMVAEIEETGTIKGY